ncbi:hypothetical protein FH972_014811 [Carpinus fangiana]|uniref:Uncharacterized protein n=1 Tax=Carpinus fangiana TaxID=176857 RepID=A0A5N6RCP8_9ROSI|nr:hypothetical protein FH972_014811 [Carpinus fangiana]
MGDGDCTARSGSGDNRLAGCDRPPQLNLDATGRYESTTVNFLQPAIFFLLTNRHIIQSIGAGCCSANLLSTVAPHHFA